MGKVKMLFAKMAELQAEIKKAWTLIGFKEGRTVKNDNGKSFEIVEIGHVNTHTMFADVKLPNGVVEIEFYWGDFTAQIEQNLMDVKGL